MGLIYFGIRVTDFERSLGFYREGLGLMKLRGGRMPHGGRRVLLADPGTGLRLELNWYLPIHRSRRRTFRGRASTT